MGHRIFFPQLILILISHINPIALNPLLIQSILLQKLAIYTLPLLTRPLLQCFKPKNIIPSHLSSQLPFFVDTFPAEVDVTEDFPLFHVEGSKRGKEFLCFFSSISR